MVTLLGIKFPAFHKYRNKSIAEIMIMVEDMFHIRASKIMQLYLLKMTGIHDIIFTDNIGVCRIGFVGTLEYPPKIP